jgi:hypothetical protein
MMSAALFIVVVGCVVAAFAAIAAFALGVVGRGRR